MLIRRSSDGRGHIVSRVTNACHHHLPSPACPYVEHLLLAGLRGKYSLCDPQLTSGVGMIPLIIPAHALYLPASLILVLTIHHIFIMILKTKKLKKMHFIKQ